MNGSSWGNGEGGKNILGTSKDVDVILHTGI